MAGSSEIRTWYLTTDEITATIAKLVKINARAVKNGLEGRYSWTLGETRHTPVLDTETGVTLGYDKVTEMVVSGEAPRIAGWTFAATLTWDGGVLVTRCSPGFEGRVDESAIRQGACDHCHADRNRYDCYLLENERGTRVQVGSSCVKDFLGHSFRPSFAVLGDDLDKIRESFGERQYHDAAVTDVLAWAVSVCKQTGWVSRQKAQEDPRLTPSGDTLRTYLFGTGKIGRTARSRYEVTSEHAAEAARVLAWARSLDPGSSEYLANVARIANSEFVTDRNVPVIGSAVASYHREMNLVAERAARPVSQHVGTVREKVTLPVTVRSDTAIESQFGVTHLYTMTDADGNVFKWFASRDQGWKTGQEVTIRGTVKAHDTYREVHQTVLTRCTGLPPQAGLEAV